MVHVQKFSFLHQFKSLGLDFTHILVDSLQNNFTLKKIVIIYGS
jgi:hypothetical protein